MSRMGYRGVFVAPHAGAWIEGRNERINERMKRTSTFCVFDTVLVAPHVGARIETIVEGHTHVASKASCSGKSGIWGPI
jgi:hypothetical protein